MDSISENHRSNPEHVTHHSGELEHSLSKMNPCLVVKNLVSIFEINHGVDSSTESSTSGTLSSHEKSWKSSSSSAFLLRLGTLFLLEIFCILSTCSGREVGLLAAPSLAML